MSSSTHEPRVYSAQEHRLPSDKIDTHAIYVTQKLRQAGHTAFVVGGSIRDLLLGHRPKDFDISTSASPEEIRALFRSAILIGRRFRLAHVRFGRKVLEVSTFRSGNLETDELIIRDNVWGSPEEDALRRDFTINGLFYDPATQEIIDYVGGFADIERKMLRTIGQPFLRFKQDPVRMIRLLKFQARFGLEVDAQAEIALLECRAEILKSASARVLEELLRMLESGSARSFIQLLSDHGMLQLILPPLASFLETEDGSDVYAYLEEVDKMVREAPQSGSPQSDSPHSGPPPPPLERSIVLSCLLFPLLQKRIQSHYLGRELIPHLGQIQDEGYAIVDEVFNLFLRLPRRLKMSIVSILTSQYRLTPLEKKRLKHKRIPSDPEFGSALKFLELRSCLEPGLELVYAEWKALFGSPEKEGVERSPRRRRRRGKRRGSPHVPPS